VIGQDNTASKWRAETGNQHSPTLGTQVLSVITLFPFFIKKQSHSAEKRQNEGSLLHLRLFNHGREG
jgi:hypothetical protein